MNLGYFTMPIHPPAREYVQTLKEDREAIILADRLGFTEAYVGEHVTDVAESVTDSAVFLASLAHSTNTIKLVPAP
jgi:alkanesulfonate monooxygenase SsuD/methylene tetrahydromethanopterin reductase-like flavin-dependent oxidoreductase (luciferase family)